MPKTREVKIKEISELPIYLTINDIVENMGYSRPEVDSWFKDKTFPMIRAGITKVMKYDLIEWLNKHKGNPRATYVNSNNINNQLLDGIERLNENIEILFKNAKID